ncbi:hypothetical protein [Paenibacillus polymyxa]|nr:hypothetical protein [Paenibacillus polymyxa]MCJ1220165.1 hypothetical protein [Paenibacillus polymyxa]
MIVRSQSYVADLYRHITLGKMPPTSEATLGVSRSVAQQVLCNLLIIIIPDYEKDTIIEDVWKVLNIWSNRS